MAILELVLMGLAIPISIALSIYIYFTLPNFLVRTFPNRFTKVDPNHAKVVQRGGEVRRVLIGSNFSMAGDDLMNPDSYRIMLRAENGVTHPEGGGQLDLFVTILEGWVFGITSYRVIGASFADLFSAQLVKYDLKRPEDLRTSMKGKEDNTDHVILSQQIYPWSVPDAKTGKVIKMTDSSGVPMESRQRLPVGLRGTYTFRVTNLWHVLYGTNFEYFPFILSMLHAGVRDEVQKLGIDDLLGEKVAGNVARGILKLNKEHEVKVSEEEDEKVPGAVGKETVKEPVKIPGTIERYGFKYTQLIVEEVTPDKGYETELQQQQRSILEKQAEISSSQLDVTVADNQLKAQRLRAKGAAAFDEERLGAIARGGKEIQDITRNATLTQGVLVADRYAEGVKEAQNGTIYVNAGGLGPMPTVDLTPRDADSKKETVSRGKSGQGEAGPQRSTK